MGGRQKFCYLPLWKLHDWLRDYLQKIGTILPIPPENIRKLLILWVCRKKPVLWNGLNECFLKPEDANVWADCRGIFLRHSVGIFEWKYHFINSESIDDFFLPSIDLASYLLQRTSSSTRRAPSLTHRSSFKSKS